MIPVNELSEEELEAEIVSLRARLQSLEQELERARKDAERYRWLREYHGIKVPTAAEHKDWKWLFLDDADIAIDTARHTLGDERG